MKGWTGKILRVDLDLSVASPDELEGEVLRGCIGGRGLASHLLDKEVEATADALGPDNKMIFATGPLTGTEAPGSGRCIVAGKSPLNGGVGLANIGGHWSAELKLAGYDALVVEGQASEPVYLWIGDEGATIRPAGHLWGGWTRQTVNQLRKETEEDAAVITIGPAGEHLARVASVVEANKRWSAGRAGLGAVMGAKKLKGIVVKGRQAVRIADRDQFLEAVTHFNTRIKAEPQLSSRLPFHGTAGLVGLFDSEGVLPSHNFQGFPFANGQALWGEAISDSLLRRRVSCFACPVGCGRATEVSDGRGEGPELEDILALGSNCGVSDLDGVVRASFLCEELGIDPVAGGAAIACAMEMQARGVLDTREAGLGMEFGDAACVLEALRLTAQRQGIGELLADGGFRLADYWGVPGLFMGVKQQALSAYVPSRDDWLALAYATSNTGIATAMDGRLVRSLLGLSAGGVLGSKSVVEKIKIQQDLNVVMESVGICPLIAPIFDGDEVASLLNGATGEGLSADDLLAAGARAWELERHFNLRAGLSPGDDRVPERVLQPAAGDQSAGFAIGDLIQEYYRIRGWDYGRPSRG